MGEVSEKVTEARPRGGRAPLCAVSRHLPGVQAPRSQQFWGLARPSTPSGTHLVMLHFPPPADMVQVAGAIGEIDSFGAELYSIVRP